MPSASSTSSGPGVGDITANNTSSDSECKRNIAKEVFIAARMTRQAPALMIIRQRIYQNWEIDGANESDCAL